jgi:hypothetical protein
VTLLPQEQQRPASKASTAQARVSITLEEGQRFPQHSCFLWLR